MKKSWPVRKITNSVAGVMVVGLMAFMSGPLFVFEPQASDSRVAAVQAASDLDSYLRESESQVLDLKPDLAKHILWAKPESREKTPISIVYLHGFSASPKDMSPVFETLGGELGANVYFARLAAHGLKDGEAFATVTPQQWIDDAREALAIGQRIGEKVLFVGMSTGALLPLELVLEGASDIAGLVLVSPNFHPKHPAAKFISGPLGKIWARILIGFYRSYEPDVPERTMYWTTKYRSEGVVAMMNLVNRASHYDLGKVKLPVLVLYTKNDTVVNARLIEKRFNDLGSSRKELVQIPEATRHEFASQWLTPAAVRPTVEKIKSFVHAI